MAAKALPPLEVLRQLLRYEPETGKMFWRERGAQWFSDGGHSAEHIAARWNSRYAGKEALITKDSFGYLAGRIFDSHYAAHRIIWAMAYGSDPGGLEVDHRDTNPSNNRLDNLRVATPSENCCNTKKRSDNTSGSKGVSWAASRSKWDARVTFKGKTKVIGRFRCKAAAEIAVALERQRMHGAFARVA